MAGYFTFGSVPSPATPIAGIRILPPGTLLSIAGGEMKLIPYWEPDFSPERKAADRSEAETLATIRERLEEAVRLRMIADVPLGAFLSGGIDSSAVVACMSRQGGRVKTFTITFPESTFDEAPFARRVAEVFGTDHTELPVTPADVRETFAAFSRALDLPSADGINTYFVSRAARQAGMTVALSGLGGDELFAGYALFRRLPPLLPFLASWRRLPRPARTTAGKILTGPSRPIALNKIGASLATADSLAHLYFIGRTIFLDGMRQEILRERFRVSPLTPEIEELARKSSRFAPIDALSFLELRHYMLNTLLRDTDNMSMAHALEVRVPLIDHHLVETVAAIPAAWKVGKDAPKRLLVKALDGILPPEIVHRPKMGFTFPFAHWLKEELAPDIDEILSDFRSGEVLDVRFVNTLWQRFRAGARDVSFSRIWTILAFEIWFRHVFEGEAR
ncbi:MAG: hypothetical protein D6812_11755 [Deltaproteobacteria bacterium]|nr:MAG: hypothetical protein D6812_11755 [Deltaproteobacteria bacterium]